MQSLIAIVASAISPLFLEVAPEVRTTYVSLGKIVEDRPMQVTSVRGGVDAGDFGRFGVRNWDVSSLTDRRHDAHHRAFYHSEIGPTWQYDFDIADDWRIKNDLTRSWTFYRRFDNPRSNRTYHWWQLVQSLENPYVVPFYRLRRTFRGTDYLYFRAGFRRRFPVWEGLSITPSVFAEGGNSRSWRRTLGPRADGEPWGAGGPNSISARLEAAWSFGEVCGCKMSAFVFVEQYGLLGGDARRANGASGYRCAHDDWTLGGAGLRLNF